MAAKPKPIPVAELVARLATEHDCLQSDAKRMLGSIQSVICQFVIDPVQADWNFELCKDGVRQMTMFETGVSIPEVRRRMGISNTTVWRILHKKDPGEQGGEQTDDGAGGVAAPCETGKPAGAQPLDIGCSG